MKKEKISSDWFFTETPFFIKLFLIFIRGDAIMLVPLILAISAIGFFSIRFLIVSLLIFAIFRFFGEMIYWLLQQFGPKTYRPYDFGLKKLDNNAIYILYQTLNLALLTISTTLFLFFLIKLTGLGFS